MDSTNLIPNPDECHIQILASETQRRLGKRPLPLTVRNGGFPAPIRVSADPELKYTNGGKAVAELTVAVNFGNGDNQRVDFIDVKVWDKWAEYLCKTAKKGSLVNVDGYLTQDRWVDKKTDENRSRLWITARTIFHVEQKFAPKDEAANGDAQPPVPDAELQPAGTGEDIPF